MKSKSFSTKNDKKLIEMIRNNPVLYNSNDRNYKNNNLKENIWTEISSSIGKNLNDCKTRWRTIRDSYKKNLKKHKSENSLEAAKSKSKYDDDTLSFLNDIARRRTKSDTSIKVETIDNVMDSEVENESLVYTETECNGIYPGPVIETINTQVDEQQMNFGSEEVLKISNKKHKTRGERDQMIKGIRKGRDKRLAMLKEMEQAEYNHPIHIFLKSMASTVMTFPPELAVETRMRVCNIVSEMELRSLTLQTYTPSMDLAMTSTQSSSTQQHITLTVDENSSNSTSSVMSDKLDCPSTSPNSNSNFSYL